MNKKKNPADSFSGMPAIVLGRSAGRIERKREEINAVTFAFNSPRLDTNIFLTKRKKDITVSAKKNTEKRTADCSTEPEKPRKEANL